MDDIRITIKAYSTHSEPNLYAVFMDGLPTQIYDTLEECMEYISRNLKTYSLLEECLR